MKSGYPRLIILEEEEACWRNATFGCPGQLTRNDVFWKRFLQHRRRLYLQDGQALVPLVIRPHIASPPLHVLQKKRAHPLAGSFPFLREPDDILT